MVKMVSNNGVPRLRALALRDYSFNNLILTVSPPAHFQTQEESDFKCEVRFFRTCLIIYLNFYQVKVRNSNYQHTKI